MYIVMKAICAANVYFHVGFLMAVKRLQTLYVAVFLHVKKVLYPTHLMLWKYVSTKVIVVVLSVNSSQFLM